MSGDLWRLVVQKGRGILACVILQCSEWHLKVYVERASNWTGRRYLDRVGRVNPMRMDRHARLFSRHGIFKPPLLQPIIRREPHTLRAHDVSQSNSRALRSALALQLW